MTNDKIKAIREELKNAGFNSRKVSVRKEYAGCSSLIEVKVKTLVALDEIEEIVKKYETISRDEYTSEVLSGGNTFIKVSYDPEFVKSIEGWDEVIKEAEEKAKENAIKNGGSYPFGYVDLNDKIRVSYVDGIIKWTVDGKWVSDYDMPVYMEILK